MHVAGKAGSTVGAAAGDAIKQAGTAVHNLFKHGERTPGDTSAVAKIAYYLDVLLLLVPLGRAGVGGIAGALRRPGGFRVADRAAQPGGYPGLAGPMRLVLPPQRRDRDAFPPTC